MAPGPGVAGTALSGASATTAAIAVPTGVAADDIILVDLYLEASRTVTAPAGFTEIGTRAATTTTWHHRFWKRATGADTGTYSFSWTTAAYRRGIAVRYPGVISSGTPYDTGAGAPTNAARSTAGTASPAVALTTQGADRLVVHSATSFSTGTWTQQAGYTERYDSGEITGAEVAQGVAGATGNVIATSTASDNQTAWLLALIPATTTVTATAGAPLGAMTGAATGTVTPAAATATAPLGGLTGAATTTRTTSASAAAALGGLTAAATAVKTVAATATAPLGGLSAAALGSGVSYLGAAGVALNPVVWLVDRDTLDVTGPPLQMWEALELSPIANSPGSCRLVYPAGGDQFDDLFGNVSASPQRDQEIEVWLAGSDATRTRWLLQQKGGDDLHPGQLWTFNGVGLEALLAEVLVGPQATDTLELVFSGVTYGTVLITALQQAQLRTGVLDGVTWDFTTTHDSDGVAWANTVSDLAFAPDDTLLAVAEVGPTEVFGEFAVGPDRVVHAWNYGTRGTDRSTGTNPLRLQAAANLTAAARRESSRVGDAATATLAKGAEGQYQWATDATAEAERGRRVEVAVDAGQITSTGGVLASAQGQLDVLKGGTAERTHGVVFGPGLPLPGLDYDVADWGLSITGGQVSTERIAQWTLLFRRDERASGTVRTNTRIQTRLDRLRRELERVRRGAVIVGTSSQSAEVDDGKSPAQVTGVTASSSAYVDADGATWASVIAGWSDVVTNADATAADDVVGYLPQYRYTGAGLPANWQPLPLVADNTIDFDGLNAGQPVDVRVAAIDKFDHIGAWSSTYSFTTGADATPPPVPSTPVVESYLGILTISWDGLGSAAQVMPPDFDRVDIYASTSSGFTPGPATYIDSLRGAGVMPSTIGNYGDTYYAKLVSVDRTGNASAASAQDSAVLVQAGDGDVSALNVGKLVTGTLSALMTVSGIIRTATSGSRVELDTNGFRCYLGSATVLDFSIPSSLLTIVGRIVSGAGIGVGPTIEIDPADRELNFYPDATTARTRLRAFTSTDPTGASAPTFWLEALDASGDNSGPILAASQNAAWLTFHDSTDYEGGAVKLYPPGSPSGTGALLAYKDATTDAFLRVSGDGKIRARGQWPGFVAAGSQDALFNGSTGPYTNVSGATIAYGATMASTMVNMVSVADTAGADYTWAETGASSTGFTLSWSLGAGRTRYVNFWCYRI